MSQSVTIPRQGIEHARAGEIEVEGRSCPIRSLDLNEVVFLAGDAKRESYEIRSGVVCLYRERYGLPPRIVELVQAGGILGLGFLDTHSFSARAVVPTVLRVLSSEETEAALERDPRLRERQAHATRQEFIARREAITAGAGGCDPLQRLARLLLAVAAQNGREGHAGDRIPDDLACGVVAGWLATDVTSLSGDLMELRRRGLVSAADDGSLTLVDMAGLEQLAAGR